LELPVLAIEISLLFVFCLLGFAAECYPNCTFRFTTLRLRRGVVVAARSAVILVPASPCYEKVPRARAELPHAHAEVRNADAEAGLRSGRVAVVTDRGSTLRRGADGAGIDRPGCGLRRSGRLSHEDRNICVDQFALPSLV
jgi:hypothetical protein